MIDLWPYQLSPYGNFKLQFKKGEFFLQTDDDLESGYLSPGSDSSRSQTHKGQNANNFVMPEHKVSFDVNKENLHKELILLLQLVGRILICDEEINNQ